MTKKTVLACLFAIYVSELLGCGSTKAEQTRAFLEVNVNKLTYEEALHRWGAPKAVMQGNDFVESRWRSEQVRIWSNQSVLAVGGIFVAFPISHGEELSLTFNKQNKTMIRWQYQDW